MPDTVTMVLDLPERRCDPNFKRILISDRDSVLFTSNNCKEIHGPEVLAQDLEVVQQQKKTREICYRRWNYFAKHWQELLSAQRARTPGWGRDSRREQGTSDTSHRSQHISSCCEYEIIPRHLSTSYAWHIHRNDIAKAHQRFCIHHPSPPYSTAHILLARLPIDCTQLPTYDCTPRVHFAVMLVIISYPIRRHIINLRRFQTPSQGYLACANQSEKSYVQ